MTIERFINLCLDKKMKEDHTPVLWRPFIEKDIADSFKNVNNGLFVSGIVSVNNDIVSKAISLFTGKYSHIVLIWATDNLKNDVYPDEWERLIKKHKFYYGDLPDTEEKLESIKYLVLGSMDRSGSNYCSYSKYMFRNQVILKPKLTPIQQKEVLHYMLREDIMDVKYDYTGLIFQLLKIFDDERAWYCSEQIYDVLIRWRCKTAKKEDPSPTDQIKYWKNWADLIYTNLDKIY